MKRLFTYLMALLIVGGIAGSAIASSVYALQNPQSGAQGLEATIPTSAPTQAATIATPSNGAVISNVPVTVSGLCQSGLLVKIFVNNVFVGSTVCTNGSYQLQVDLFSGRNDIVARVYDALDQSGPDSNVVSVTFNDAQFLATGSRVTITSDYARRGANPGDELDWPVTIAGGAPPYAISVDWGDNKAADLQSSAFGGTIDLKHVYDSAGTYQVTVKVTDAKGVSAFLQLVGVANGAVQASSTGGKPTATTITRTNVLWWPTLAGFPMLLVAFWLGQRHELYTLRRKLESQ